LACRQRFIRRWVLSAPTLGGHVDSVAGALGTSAGHCRVALHGLPTALWHSATASRCALFPSMHSTDRVHGKQRPLQPGGQPSAGSGYCSSCAGMAFSLHPGLWQAGERNSVEARIPFGKSAFPCKCIRTLACRTRHALLRAVLAFLTHATSTASNSGCLLHCWTARNSPSVGTNPTIPSPASHAPLRQPIVYTDSKNYTAGEVAQLLRDMGQPVVVSVCCLVPLALGLGCCSAEAAAVAGASSSDLAPRRTSRGQHRGKLLASS